MISLFLTAVVSASVLAVMTPDMNSDSKAPQPTNSLNVQAQMPGTTLPGKWLTSFEEARQLAQTQQVPLIVHFEASWCGPCRQMEASVLSQPRVLQQLSSSFVGVRVDADRNSALISRFGISSLPTEIILSPDGSEAARYVGVTSLDSYVSRLQARAGDTAVARKESTPAEPDAADQAAETADEKLRSCLLVQHDGKTVGLGGFSPVALVTSKVWEKGSEEFVAAHEGVEYFFRSGTEREQFLKSPEKYVPRLHGCDPVEFHRDNRAEAGAIEFGAFYKGQLYFFSSLENRQHFQSNPDYYADAVSTDDVQNEEKFPFLKHTASLK